LLLRHELSGINKNVAWIAAELARQQVGNGQQWGDEQTGAESVPGAMPERTTPTVVGLMPRPTTLQDLWTEWTIGTYKKQAL
jgi:hypothetical protein